MDWIRNRSPFIIMSTITGALLTLFLILPIISSVVGSAQDIPTAFSDERTINAIYTSFYCAFLATVFTLIFGIPFAYIFARNDFFGKKLIDSLIDLPILVPHNAAGIALLYMLSPISPIGKALDLFNLSVVDTILGIVIAMMFVSSPFMIRNAQEAFLSINPAVERVSRSLGASQFKTFVYITLPLALRGIITGCLLTWARAVSEFGAVVMIAYYPKTVPVQLYDVFVSEGLRAALPISSLLIVLSLIILLVFRMATTKPVKPTF
jgi:molybdate/tungstate transport system permease protein